MASTSPPWSKLPPELLGLVIERLVVERLEAPPGRSCFSALWSKALQLLPSHHAGRFRAALRSRQSAYADCARFGAVCRSWCSAMREHVTTDPWHLPWIVMSECSFMAPSSGSRRIRLPSLPENAICIGSTDSWLALDCMDDNDYKKRRHFLHNPFSNTTVPLPELDAVIGYVSELFEVRTVVMLSTTHDIIAVMTNNWNHPIMLIRPGKGVWSPEPQAAPFMYIIDIAFFGDKLYGITQAEDLVSLDLAFDDNGMPSVTDFARLIRHPPGNYHFRVWRDADEDDDNHDAENDRRYQEALIADNGYMRAIREIRAKTGDDTLFTGITYWEDDEVPSERKDLVGVIWYLLKSRGKLFVVKRETQWPYCGSSFTRKMEISELNFRTCAWVPVSGGLDGHAFFISERFCKSVAAHGDIKEDTVY